MQRLEENLTNRLSNTADQSSQRQYRQQRTMVSVATSVGLAAATAGTATSTLLLEPATRSAALQPVDKWIGSTS